MGPALLGSKGVRSFGVAMKRQGGQGEQPHSIAIKKTHCIFYTLYSVLHVC